MQNTARFNVPSSSGPMRLEPLPMGGVNPRGDRIGVNNLFMEWNGRPWLPVMGEFHPSRYPCAAWEEEIVKIKAGGVQIIACYVFWIHHEEDEGVFDFSGDRDIRRFLEHCAKHHMPVVLRIGPFCHGEVRNGGLPDWLYGQPFEARGNNPRYLACVERFYSEIGKQARGIMFKDGGPVIGIQCENEFMDSAAPWETTQNTAMEYTPRGAGGLEHMKTLKALAIKAGLDAPLFTATAWGKSPVDVREALPLFGGYAFYSWLDDPSQQGPSPNYSFMVRHGRPSDKFDTASVPVACCELGGGMQVFYRNRPIVPPCSVECMHVTYLGSGTNVSGYYMYHGGSNPVGKHATLNEHRCPRISYDFQAPIREFGQLSETYHRLKRQFMFLETWGEALAPMLTVLAEGLENVQADDPVPLRCAIRVADGRGFVFLNNYQDHVELQDHVDVHVDLNLGDDQLRIPAAGSFTLKKNICAVLPFNLSLDGILLRHATVQSLTRVAFGNGECHVFFAIPGIPCEYAFIADAGVRVAAGKGALKRIGIVDVLSVEPGLDSMIHIVDGTGNKASLLTLTDEQSLASWKVRMKNRDRLLISTVDLVPWEDRLELLPSGDASASLRILAAGPDELPVVSAATAHLVESSFVRLDFESSRPRPAVRFTVETCGPGHRVIRIPADALKDANELFLEIDYVGDVGQAFIRGKLVHDNFCNGTPWEIGLKRFMTPGEALELVIRIVPARTGGGGPNVQYSPMAAMTLADAGTVEIRSIFMTPQFKVAVPLVGC